MLSGIKIYGNCENYKSKNSKSCCNSGIWYFPNSFEELRRDYSCRRYKNQAVM